MLNRGCNNANSKSVVAPGFQSVAVIVVTEAHSLVGELGGMATLSASLAGSHLNARVNFYRDNGFGSGGIAVGRQVGAGDLKFVDLLGLRVHRGWNEGPYPGWTSFGTGIRGRILADGDAVENLDVIPSLSRSAADDLADALVRPLPHGVMPWASRLGTRIIEKKDDGSRCRLASIHLTCRVMFITK